MTSPDSSLTQEGSKPETRGVIEVAHLIRADVNAVTNWSEALHIVMAAAAIARVCWGPSRGRVAGTHFQQPGKGAVVFVLSVCWERQPDPSTRARG